MQTPNDMRENDITYELTPADHVWNRAALESGGDSPAEGDIALESILYAHGLACNGGVFHAVTVKITGQR